jgi:MFS family permease
MKRVLELPAFRRLLVAAVLNELAFSVGSVALALLVYHRTGSALGAAAFFLCAEFAPALVTPFLVARLDQRSVRWVLVVLYSVEGAVYLALAWLVGRFALIPVLALALIDGALAVTARVLARSAWTALTSPAGLLREANAIINTSLAAAFMIGPAIGGVVVAVGGTSSALLVNVGLFTVVTLAISTAGGLPRAVPNPVPTAGRLRAALRRARADSLVRRLLGLESLGMVFFTISIPVEVVLVRHTLDRGPGAYGVLLSAWGAGGIIGSAAYARWRTLSSRHLISLGTFALGVGFLVMAIAPSLSVAIAGSAIAGVGNGIQIVAFRTALQEATPASWMALILSFNEAVFQAIPGGGILLGGAITALSNARVALGVAAAGSIVLGVVMWVGLAAVSVTASQAAMKPAEKADEPLTVAVRRS